ncbi:GNAT family N-acetyltransferase [Chryseobacterium arthrosphaerae]|uniref:GNAT family N-acetyltransferase n=1 Tax=Chryseobacterium arthrosphaerae TaxID=651561 RepID=UPI001E44F923|nr:GNAT family N-acetyltransferase [Chryseobacterium arthrosphaerae]UEQ78455.1 GNAT family N-acetyltransferase [Chryseobacterium arthrosphaerae]
MKLETERLILKEVDESYTEDILKIRSNPYINQYVKRNSPQNNYEALEFILHIKNKIQNGDMLFWGISFKDQRNLVGTICIWNFSDDRKTAEVGYELLPDYHKKGIMGEALNRVLEYGFDELNLQKILAYTHQFNEASQSLLLKHRFISEEGMKDNNNPENVIFSLNRI